MSYVAARTGNKEAFEFLSNLVKEDDDEDSNNEHDVEALAIFFGQTQEKIREELVKGWIPPKIK